MSDPAAIHLGDLPATAREMAEVIGLDAALAIVRRYGGVRLWIGRKGPSGELVDLIGPEKSEALRGRYGKQVIVVPRAQAAMQAAWDAQIMTEYHQTNATQGELALRHGCTERTIGNALKRAIARADAPPPPAPIRDDRQTQLFG
ncbi:MAG: hypothetical protein OEW11_09630 [Nitrospirota bacterium]|nr:hypothetical protein [Nitrospirota bacterium]